MRMLEKYISKPLKVLVIGSAFVANISYGSELENLGCFDLPYFESTVSQEEAFGIAECFYQEATFVSSPVNTGRNSVNTSTPNKRFLLLQYADSWYRHADQLGHPHSYAYLTNINDLLNDLNN